MPRHKNPNPAKAIPALAGRFCHSDFFEAVAAWIAGSV
jgi:hypothetical protein